MSVPALLRGYSERWPTEPMFRDSKQLLGFAQSSARVVIATAHKAFPYATVVRHAPAVVDTRNVRVRATFPNADGRLRPGMFVNVDVISPEKRRVLLIPSTAVLYAPYGDSVFAIEEKKNGDKATLTAHQKFVRLGERRGDLVAVASGLAAGETIVSSGAFKLRNGMAVVVRNDLAPSAELAPKPVDE